MGQRLEVLNLLLEADLLLVVLDEFLILLLLNTLDLLQIVFNHAQLLLKRSHLLHLLAHRLLGVFKILFEVGVHFLLQGNIVRVLFLLVFQVLAQLTNLRLVLIVQNDLGSLLLSDVLVQLGDPLLLIMSLGDDLLFAAVELLEQVGTLRLFLLELPFSIHFGLVQRLLLLDQLGNLFIQRLLFLQQFLDFVFLFLDL